MDTVSKFIEDLNKRNDEYCRVVNDNADLHKQIKALVAERDEMESRWHSAARPIGDCFDDKIGKLLIHERCTEWLEEYELLKEQDRLAKLKKKTKRKENYGK